MQDTLLIIKCQAGLIKNIIFLKIFRVLNLDFHGKSNLKELKQNVTELRMDLIIRNLWLFVVW